MEEYERNDAKTAIGLHLEEVQQFEEKRKGKSNIDSMSDEDMTIALWQEELQTFDQSLSDHTMALAISNAVATDQHIISEMQREDREIERDRALAMSLSEDAAEALGPNQPTPVEHDFRDVEAESVCEIMTSLAQMSIVENEPAAVDDETTVASTSFADERCVACLENVRAKPVFLPACNHRYCNNCIRQVFLAATRDEELYPPRCCKNVFPPGIALRLLNYRELAAFCSKGVEFSCSDRTYCADPQCSAFIPPWEIQNKQAKCPTCTQTTHMPCKTLFDAQHECPLDEALQQVLSLGEAENWRRCGHCRTLVELRQGCNHITCRCGKEFCYVCGAEWRTCECPLWSEQRLYEVAHRVVEDQVPARADEVVRAQVLAEAVHNLRHHENAGCEHARRSQWQYLAKPRRQCEMCYHTLPEYIFECTSCRMLACNRCIRNRMR